MEYSSSMRSLRVILHLKAWPVKLNVCLSFDRYDGTYHWKSLAIVEHMVCQSQGCMKCFADDSFRSKSTCTAVRGDCISSINQSIYAEV